MSDFGETKLREREDKRDEEQKGKEKGDVEKYKCRKGRRRRRR